MLKSFPPPIDSHCHLIGILSHDGKPFEQEDSSHVLVDLTGGANCIEWSPNLQIQSGMRGVSIQRGQDTYSLRVWKRRHGPLDVTGGGYDYTEPAFTDPWADWLETHSECGFLIAGVEFRVMSMSPSRNGIEFWLTGRRVQS